MSKLKILSLIARVEQAKGPNRNLDRDIWDTLGYEVHCFDPGDGDVFGWRQWANGDKVMNTHVTGSIDAAVTLMKRELPVNEDVISGGPDYLLGKTNGGLTIHCQIGEGKQYFGETEPLAIMHAFLQEKLRW